MVIAGTHSEVKRNHGTEPTGTSRTRSISFQRLENLVV
jgi:hypothetical protein